MWEFPVKSRLKAEDLNVFYCGHEQCKPGHTCGPAMRDHYLLVYIKNGRGTYKVNNRTYQLQKHDSFVLFPGVPAYYAADPSDPWEYIWIGFYGKSAGLFLQYADLKPDSPVHHHKNPDSAEELLTKLLQMPLCRSVGDEMYCLGLLHIILSGMVNDSSINSVSMPSKENSASDDYIQKAVDYIHQNYASNITASTIADHIGLERSYFSRLFKLKLKVAPHEFLLKYRVEKALRLLNHTTSSIENIAFSVGFTNSLYFSKVFKKFFGQSPSAYRKTGSGASQ